MSSFIQFWYVCMSGICLTSVTKSFGSIFEIFMKNKNLWHLWRKISENDPAYQFLQITTSVSLYLKVYFLQFLLWKWSVILRMTVHVFQTFLHRLLINAKRFRTFGEMALDFVKNLISCFQFTSVVVDIFDRYDIQNSVKNSYVRQTSTLLYHTMQPNEIYFLLLI